MTRKNFHRVANSRAAVVQFLKTESEKGLKVYWDRGHIQGQVAGEAHNNAGVGIYCVSCKPRDDYDQQYSYNTATFMLLKSDADIEEMFTYYEDGEQVAKLNQLIKALDSTELQTLVEILEHEENRAAKDGYILPEPFYNLKEVIVRARQYNAIDNF